VSELVVVVEDCWRVVEGVVVGDGAADVEEEELEEATALLVVEDGEEPLPYPALVEEVLVLEDLVELVTFVEEDFVDEDVP